MPICDLLVGEHAAMCQLFRRSSNKSLLLVLFINAIIRTRRTSRRGRLHKALRRHDPVLLIAWIVHKYALKPSQCTYIQRIQTWDRSAGLRARVYIRVRTRTSIPVRIAGVPPFSVARRPDHRPGLGVVSVIQNGQKNGFSYLKYISR